MNRLCSCGNEARAGGRYCRACHAKYMRSWRKEHPLSAEQRVRDAARSQAGVYLKRGQIQRKPCEVCGDRAEMHHPDHEQPRFVAWLCREHHLAWHRHWRTVSLSVFRDWLGVKRETHVSVSDQDRSAA